MNLALSLADMAPCRFGSLFDSPLGSSMLVRPFLLPAGGVPLPSGSSFSQPPRAAATHRLLVQTPLVYPNAPTVRLLVQCYDRFGNTLVAPPSVGITLAMGGLSLSRSSFSGSTADTTLGVYTATLPPGWFAHSGPSAAQVSTRLNGGHEQQSSLQVFGHPAWSGS